MSENERIKRPVENIIATVVDREDDHDPETVREVLDPITDEGTVIRQATRTAVSDTSKVVATAETRVELARIASEDAIAVAATVDDLDIVAARLNAYAERLEVVEAQVADITDDLQPPVEQLADPTAVYELAVGLRDVATSAQSIVRTADELATDLEEFESWLTEPDKRYDEFGEDIDLIDESVTELTAAAAALPTESDAPAADWAAAKMWTRVLELLIGDLRAELADLQAWADREDAPFRAVLDERVTNLERRTGELADTLAELAEPAWCARFEEHLAALERDLKGVEPPVDWEHVQGALEEQRKRAFDE